MNKYAVQIKNLNWSYGDKHILKNITMDFEENKFYSIIGPNGSGKTTLLKNISKMLKPSEKSIFIKGSDVLSLSSKNIARKLSFVPQTTAVDFDFSVMDMVLMGRSPYIKRFQYESEKDIEIAKNAMKITNTWHLKDESISNLSGGEQQRVIAARAITQDTPIILLDEPISHLDIHHQIELLDTIKFISKHCTVISVLHDLNLAAQYSDYLILMKNGEITASGTPNQILTVENVEQVYDIKITLIKNPITGKPHIIPVTSQFI